MSDCVKRYKQRRDERLRSRKAECVFHEDYGVKGMKWGEHNSEEEESSTVRNENSGLSKSNPRLYEKYEKILKNAEEKAKNNPSAITYEEMKQNYGTVLKSAEGYNPKSNKQSGIHAAIAMEEAKLGDVVEIKGNIFEGRYELKNVKSPFSDERVPCWVALDKKNHNHAFANNTLTIMGEMRMVKGGKWIDDKEKSIKKEINHE